VKGIILAAGKGERMRPLTDFKPKSLLPVGNKPLIDYQIEMLEKIGVKEIAVVVGYLEEEMKKHLKDRVKFFRDEKIKGTASALYSARNFIDEDFILIYGDIFFDGSLTSLAEKPNSIGVTEVADVSRYGKIVTKGGKLEAIEEKSGEGKGMINAGIYHLTSDVLEFVESTGLSKRGEYELTDSIISFSKKKPIHTIVLEGYWKDIGYPWEYLDANLYLLEKIKFYVGENTEIWENATLRKPVIIGDDCTIKNCVVESSVIGNHCVIGEFSVVKRSVIMDHSKVPHLNYVGDSIIAEGCNLGAGTKIANLRFDEKNVKFTIKGQRIDTGRKKFGAVIGYNVKTGINVSIYPGVKIGSNSWIGGAVLVKKDVENNSFVTQT